jgi:hypothetical protein
MAEVPQNLRQELERIATLQADMEARILILESMPSRGKLETEPRSRGEIAAISGQAAEGVCSRIEEAIGELRSQIDLRHEEHMASIQDILRQMQSEIEEQFSAEVIRLDDKIEHSCQQATEAEVAFATVKAAVDGLGTVEMLVGQQQKQIEDMRSEMQVVQAKIARTARCSRGPGLGVLDAEASSSLFGSDGQSIITSANCSQSALEHATRRPQEGVPLLAARCTSPPSRTASPYPQPVQIAKGRLAAAPPPSSGTQAAPRLAMATPTATPMQMRPLIPASNAAWGTPANGGGSIHCNSQGNVRNSPGANISRVPSQSSPVPSSVSLPHSNGERNSEVAVPATDELWLKALPCAYLPLCVPTKAAVRAPPAGRQARMAPSRCQASPLPSPRGRVRSNSIGCSEGTYARGMLSRGGAVSPTPPLIGTHGGSPAPPLMGTRSASPTPQVVGAVQGKPSVAADAGHTIRTIH